jgi:hypothetical protein
VRHYNAALGLNLTPEQMNDLFEYLKSLYAACPDDVCAGTVPNPLARSFVSQ